MNIRFKHPRVKSNAHLNFVRSLPCVCCMNNIETQAAHVRFSEILAGKRMVGTGEKPDDGWTVPLCGSHHREQHSKNERVFWESQGIDPVYVAMALWINSGDYDAGMQVLQNARN
jgi:hypothetical protein